MVCRERRGEVCLIQCVGGHANRAAALLAVVVGEGVAGDRPQIAQGIGDAPAQQDGIRPQQDLLRQVLRVLRCGASAQAVAVDGLHLRMQEGLGGLFVHGNHLRV